MFIGELAAATVVIVGPAHAPLRVLEEVVLEAPCDIVRHRLLHQLEALACICMCVYECMRMCECVRVSSYVYYASASTDIG